MLEKSRRARASRLPRPLTPEEAEKIRIGLEVFIKAEKNRGDYRPDSKKRRTASRELAQDLRLIDAQPAGEAKEWRRNKLGQGTQRSSLSPRQTSLCVVGYSRGCRTPVTDLRSSELTRFIPEAFLRLLLWASPVSDGLLLHGIQITLVGLGRIVIPASVVFVDLDPKLQAK